MVYHGRVEKGVVVLDDAATLPEGMRVRVEAEGDGQERKVVPGTLEAILQVQGKWQGEGAEVDRLLAELKQMKREEVARQELEPDVEL